MDNSKNNGKLPALSGTTVHAEKGGSFAKEEKKKKKRRKKKGEGKERQHRDSAASALLIVYPLEELPLRLLALRDPV